MNDHSERPGDWSVEEAEARQDREAAAFIPDDLDRDGAIARIRRGLRARTGRSWSVTGGRGTSWGWITISVPPSQRVDYGTIAPADRAELARALGLDVVHQQGVSIPAGHDYRIEYVDRAEGRAPRRLGVPYWD